MFDTQTAFNLVGHLSFALTAAAYLMTDIVKLRAIALISLAAGLVYNATLASGPLWLVIFWLSVFLCINVYRISKEVVDRLEISLPSHERALMVDTFPKMHSRDWRALMKIANRKVYQKGEVLLGLGDSTSAVCLLAGGQALETRVDGRATRRTPGAMWGELSFVTEDQFDGSPCTIVVSGSQAVVLEFPYEALHGLTAQNLRLRSALMEGFVRTAGLKHGLLANDPDSMPCGLSALNRAHTHREHLEQRPASA